MRRCLTALLTAATVGAMGAVPASALAGTPTPPGGGVPGPVKQVIATNQSDTTQGDNTATGGDGTATGGNGGNASSGNVQVLNGNSIAVGSGNVSSQGGSTSAQSGSATGGNGGNANASGGNGKAGQRVRHRSVGQRLRVLGLGFVEPLLHRPGRQHRHRWQGRGDGRQRR